MQVQPQDRIWDANKKYQFMFSDSALFFKIHNFTVLQFTGRWVSSVHCRAQTQNQLTDPVYWSYTKL